MNLSSILESERRTPLDQTAKREQIAGMFQKLIKTEKDVTLLTTTTSSSSSSTNHHNSSNSEDGLSLLLGTKFLLNPCSALIRRRTAACIANVTSLDSPLVHVQLKRCQNQTLNSVIQMLKQFGCLQSLLSSSSPSPSSTCSSSSSNSSPNSSPTTPTTPTTPTAEKQQRSSLTLSSDLDSGIVAIQYASLSLLNLMSILGDAQEQQSLVRHGVDVGAICDCLTSFVMMMDWCCDNGDNGGAASSSPLSSLLRKFGYSWQHEVISDIISNLMIVLSMMALNEPLCVQMCRHDCRSCEQKRHTNKSDTMNGTVKKNENDHHRGQLCQIVTHVLSLANVDDIDGSGENRPTSQMLEACLALLWNIALCESTRQLASEHCDERVMSVLVSMTRKSANDKLRSRASHVIQILSTVESTQQYLTSDIPSLVQCVTMSSSSGGDIKTGDILHAVGTIWNIATSAESRQEISNCGGARALVSLVKKLLTDGASESRTSQQSDTLQLMYKVTGALTAVTLSNSICGELGELGCIDLLFQVLESKSLKQDLSISENTLSVLSNLAVDERNRELMRTMDRVKLLVSYLDLPKGQSSEDDQMLKLAERASNVLTSLSVEVSGGELIRQAGGIEKLVQLLKAQDATNGSNGATNREGKYTRAQKTATTALWNLSLIDENMQLIEDLKAIKPLVAMLPQTTLDDTVFVNNVKKAEEQEKEDEEAVAMQEAANPELFHTSGSSGEDDTDSDSDLYSDLETSVPDVSESSPRTSSPDSKDNSKTTITTTTGTTATTTSTTPASHTGGPQPLKIPNQPVTITPKVVIPAVNLAAAAEAARQSLQELTTRRESTLTPKAPNTPKAMPSRVSDTHLKSLANAKNARLGKKWEHIRLLINSEREYIELLAWMDQNFMASNSYIMRNNMIDEQAHSDIFQDMDCLRMVNLDLYIELEKLYLEFKDSHKERDEELMIGLIITKRSPTLRLYKTYANNLKRAIDTLSGTMNTNASFRDFIAQNSEEIKRRSARLDNFTKSLFFSRNGSNEQERAQIAESSSDVSVDVILQDLLLKKPTERIHFYVQWLQEMMNVHTSTTHQDHKYLKEADKQLSIINDYCVKKLQQLETLDLFSKLLSEHPFSLKQKKYFLMKNVGFPEPQGFQSYHVWNRRYEKLLARSYKVWSNYKGPIDAKSKIVRKIINKYGVVPLMRPRVWMALSGAQRKMEENSGYYQRILLSGSKSLSPTIVEKIDRDVMKTYNDHPLFQEEDSAVISAMRRIFVAYSTRNPLVNYSQSFNYICGLMLLHLPEESVFWLFVSLVESYLPQNFFSPGLKGVLVDASILDELIYQHHSKIAIHFKKLNFDLSAFSMAFMMKLFAGDFPYETTLRIWDKFFLEGVIVLFKVILGLLKINEGALLKAPDITSLVLCFRNMIVKPCFDVDKLLKTADKYDRTLNNEKIDSLRRKYASLIDAELRR